MIRIVPVDDQELVRAGLRQLAQRDGDIEVVAEAADGEVGVSWSGSIGLMWCSWTSACHGWTASPPRNASSQTRTLPRYGYWC